MPEKQHTPKQLGAQTKQDVVDCCSQMRVVMRVVLVLRAVQ
jgi:hypothetical protein